MPLPNKQGEPPFKMKVEPDRLVFAMKKNLEECVITFTVHNSTTDRMCYKVKCTDNELFRVRPPLGFVKPGDTTTIKITLRPKPGIDAMNHFFAIYHVVCNDTKNVNPRAVWNAETVADGVIRLAARFDLEGAKRKQTDEPEDKKKKEEKKEEKKDEKEDEKHDDEKQKEEKPNEEKKE